MNCLADRPHDLAHESVVGKHLKESDLPEGGSSFTVGVVSVPLLQDPQQCLTRPINTFSHQAARNRAEKCIDIHIFVVFVE